ncbi:MAG: DUF885 domain-containing protein [Erythrobacter sp.]
MNKFALTIAALALPLTGCMTAPNSADIQAAAQNVLNADAAFEELSKRYLEGVAELNPVYATALGNHAYDAKLPDVSAKGRANQYRFSQGFLIALKTIDFDALSKANQVDYKLLQNALEYGQWSSEEEQQWAWNPQYYHSTASSSLYGLVSRDFAPFETRLPNIIARMNALPEFLTAARAQIQVARVPKVHAETVAKQNAGIMGIVTGIIEPELTKSNLNRTEFDAAKAKLAAALAEHQVWLDEVIVPGAKGDFRLGEEMYAQKMAYALQTDMSVAELKARADKAFYETRAQMLAVSMKIGECGSIQGRSEQARQQAVISCGLNASYENRAPRDGLEDAARKTLAEATEFTRKTGFIRMADNETQIITMPEFWQGNAVAYLDSPAPLESELPAYYAVSPIPDAWTDEQATSFLKEYNISMLHLLSIHEGTPGHALQLDHANKYDGLLRSVLSSGPFIEGWAVYSEKVVADAGYLGGMETEQGRFFLLNGLKFRLRAITNTLLDIGIHTEGMTRDEAMQKMIQGAFQQEREAAGKWTRANLSSIQLLSYFTGYTEHVALREEAEQRWGADFDARKYHDGVLSYGSPPVKYARSLLFDLPVE